MADEILSKAGANKADPSTVNPKLAALNLAKELMNGKNPTTAVISDEFCLGQSLYTSINEMFIVFDDDGKPMNNGLNAVVEVFKEFEEYSASIGGQGRQQIVECVVNQGRNYYSSVSPLMGPDKPAALSRLLGFFKGSGGGGTQQ